LGMARPEDGLEGNGGHADQSSAVQAVVAYSTPTDLARLHEDCCKGKVGFPLGGWVRQSLEKSLGGTPEKVLGRYKKASPVNYARKGIAPVLLIHGRADVFVPFEQSRLLADRITDAGGRASLLGLAGAGHDFEMRDDANARLAALAAAAFL